MEAFAKKKGKEGTRGSGQILRENTETLTFYRNMILGANGLYFTIMTLFGRNYFTFDISMFIVSSLIYICCFQFMRSMGQATVGEGGAASPGMDLNMEGGLAEHLKVTSDLLWWKFFNGLGVDFSSFVKCVLIFLFVFLTPSIQFLQPYPNLKLNNFRT